MQGWNRPVNPILKNSAAEYIAVTTMHEVLHAWMTYMGKLGEFNQHTEMAQVYVYGMKTDLVQMFPGMNPDEAEAIA